MDQIDRGAAAEIIERGDDGVAEFGQRPEFHQFVWWMNLFIYLFIFLILIFGFI